MATIHSSWRAGQTIPLAMATSLLAMASLDSQLSGKTLFSLQNPNFDSPLSKFVLKVCLNVYEHKKALKFI